MFERIKSMHDNAMDGQLGKIKYYVIRVEFQARGSPHVHCLLWAENLTEFRPDNKQEYIDYIDNVMSTSLPTGEESAKLTSKKISN